jgi:beta-lactamase class A
MHAEDDLAAIFDRAGARGFVHAVAIDTPDHEVALDADEPVITASVFKVPVMLELARQAAAGRFALTDRVVVPAAGRTTGPTGLSVMSDDIELSVRDLGYLMMSVSDNAATDIVMARVGVDSIAATLHELGLKHTFVPDDCHTLLAQMMDDLGIADDQVPDIAALPPEVITAARGMTPGPSTNCTTPRDMTRLLSLIWRDEAGPPEACAEVRRIMGLQVWPHRLSSGFGDGVKVSGKTGTLPGIRNEAGVIELADGRRYAVAVFTRARSYAFQQPAIDAAIGAAARAAVDALEAVTAGATPRGS